MFWLQHDVPEGMGLFSIEKFLLILLTSVTSTSSSFPGEDDAWLQSELHDLRQGSI